MTVPGPAVQARQFRWKFSDNVLHDQWSRWHVDAASCGVCCCGDGPDRDGEHREAAEFYDDDGFLSPGHSYLDPADPDPWVTVEWRPSGG